MSRSGRPTRYARPSPSSSTTGPSSARARPSIGRSSQQPTSSVARPSRSTVTAARARRASATRRKSRKATPPTRARERTWTAEERVEPRPGIGPHLHQHRAPAEESLEGERPVGEEHRQRDASREECGPGDQTEAGQELANRGQIDEGVGVAAAHGTASRSHGPPEPLHPPLPGPSRPTHAPPGVTVRGLPHTLSWTALREGGLLRPRAHAWEGPHDSDPRPFRAQPHAPLSSSEWCWRSRWRRSATSSTSSTSCSTRWCGWRACGTSESRLRSSCRRGCRCSTGRTRGWCWEACSSASMETAPAGGRCSSEASFCTRWLTWRTPSWGRSMPTARAASSPASGSQASSARE